MIAALLVVLAVEFLNTAIEKLSDHVTPEQHRDIGRIKDFGSSAVFCALALAGSGVARRNRGALRIILSILIVAATRRRPASRRYNFFIHLVAR